MVVEEFLKRGLIWLQKNPKEAYSASERYLQLVMAGAPIRNVALLVHGHEGGYKPVRGLHNYIFGAQDAELNVDAVLRSIEGKQVRKLLLEDRLSLKTADLVRRIAKAKGE